MKKYLILLALAIMPFVATNAQIAGKSSDPSVEFVIKRVTDMGNGSFRINLYITNHGKEDLRDVQFESSEYNSKRLSQAYDDEGVVYNSQSWFMIVDGKRLKYPYPHSGYYELPTDVPVKFLIDIDNVDEFATAFLRLDLILTHNTGQYTHIYCQFNKVPLPRNQ